MMPIGPLMIEHRLIERMIKILNQAAIEMNRAHKADPVFIDTAVDFIRTYADRCHHGKEEDILFRDLRKKQLAPEYDKIMRELIEEHVWARKKVGELVAAKERYVSGAKENLKNMATALLELTTFYPQHIAKEDKDFFLPIMDYFTKEERAAMLAEFYEFDRKLIHEKYIKLIERLEQT